jgi:hypothetical protein
VVAVLAAGLACTAGVGCVDEGNYDVAGRGEKALQDPFNYGPQTPNPRPLPKTRDGAPAQPAPSGGSGGSRFPEVGDPPQR